MFKEVYKPKEKEYVNYYHHKCYEKHLEDLERKNEDGIKKKIEKNLMKLEAQRKRNVLNEAADIFYNYTGSLATKFQLNTAFKAMKDIGMTEEDILYTMNYIVRNKCVLNYPMGIRFYADRARIERRTIEANETAQNKNMTKSSAAGIVVENERIIKKTSRKEDDLDISNFL